MPEPELSNGELGRMVGALRTELQSMVNGLNSRLDRVVSTDVYALQSQHVADRLSDLARETQSARDDYRKLEEAFDAYKLAEAARREDERKDAAARRDRERQARLYQAIVPILIALLSTITAVWAVTR